MKEMKKKESLALFSLSLSAVNRMPVGGETDSLRTPVSAVAAGCGGVGPAAAPALVVMSTQKQQHMQQHKHQQQQRPSARKQPLQQVDENGVDVSSSSSLSLAAVAAASAAAHGPAPPPELEYSLVDRVRSSLELHLLDNALFLAERLVADFPSEVRIWSEHWFSSFSKNQSTSTSSPPLSLSLSPFLFPHKTQHNRPTTASSPTSTSAPTPRTAPAPPSRTRGSNR